MGFSDNRFRVASNTRRRKIEGAQARGRLWRQGGSCRGKYEWLRHPWHPSVISSDKKNRYTQNHRKTRCKTEPFLPSLSISSSGCDGKRTRRQKRRGNGLAETTGAVQRAAGGERSGGGGCGGRSCATSPLVAKPNELAARRGSVRQRRVGAQGGEGCLRVQRAAQGGRGRGGRARSSAARARGAHGLVRVQGRVGRA